MLSFWAFERFEYKWLKMMLTTEMVSIQMIYTRLSQRLYAA